VFRDDHEAALARLQALEEELARERAKDVKQEQRLDSLEAQLAAAKEKLRQTEAELAIHKPPEPPRRESRLRPPAGSEPYPNPPLPPGRGAAIAAATLLIGVVVIGLVMMKRSRTEDAGAGSATREVPAPESTPFMTDQVSDLLPDLRAYGHERLPGSRMVELEGKGITSDGSLHETYGAIDGTFYVKARRPEPEVDPNLPVGAAPPVHASLDEHKCTYVRRDAKGWAEHPMSVMNMCVMGDLFGQVSELEPSCSMRSIWSRAIADGAPADAIAEISLRRGLWHFTINDQRLQFRRTYSDDCRR
jgi:hypothetical protein